MTTPGTQKLEVLKVEELPEDIRKYFIESAIKGLGRFSPGSFFIVFEFGSFTLFTKDFAYHLANKLIIIPFREEKFHGSPYTE
jgi:hypothetical protein